MKTTAEQLLELDQIAEAVASAFGLEKRSVFAVVVCAVTGSTPPRGLVVSETA